MNSFHSFFLHRCLSNSVGLSYWDVQAHDWKVAPGDYPILIGSSSEDIRLRDQVYLE